MRDILLKSIYASPLMTAGPNTVITVTDAEAAALVAGGYAEYVRLEPIDAPAAETPESAGDASPTPDGAPAKKSSKKSK